LSKAWHNHPVAFPGAGKLLGDKGTDAFELKTMTCRVVMTPREQLLHVNAETPVEQILELARTKNVSRLPVRDEAKQPFIGLITLTDVLDEILGT
jgi:CBS domain containing-hemolysin-like protein